MRYVKIFFIYFYEAFEYRGRAFVWFLLSFINPLMVLLFWRGAFQSGESPLSGWTYNSIATYYLLLVIASSLLQVHIEEEVAQKDIHAGFLSQYLTKPFPYIVSRFFTELPWRLIQGFFGILVFVGFYIFLKNSLFLIHDGVSIIASITIIVLAFFLSFIFKMIVGISSLWITEYSGLQEVVGVVELIFAGFIMPISLFPEIVRTISYIFPFSYMFYFPIVSLLGKLSPLERTQVIAIQIFWLLIFWVIYQKLWKNGVKKFTGLGQ